MKKGYDVVFLANKNRHVTGMDLSENCVEALNKVIIRYHTTNYYSIILNIVL